jgi:hypothetical protein
VRKIKSYFFISLDGVVESPDKWQEVRRLQHPADGGGQNSELVSGVLNLSYAPAKA